MSSDEEQEGAGRRGGRMAFTDQNDFEGGRWINGEYYYENQRKGQMQTEDDRILGVFQDGSSDEEQGGRGRKGNKKGSRKQNVPKQAEYGKPMSFVGGNRRGAGSGSGDGKKDGVAGKVDSDKRVLGAMHVDDETGDADSDDDNIPDEEAASTSLQRHKTQEQFKNLLKAASAEAPPVRPHQSRVGIPPDSQGAGLGIVSAAAGNEGAMAATPLAADTRSNADFRALLGQVRAPPPPPPPPPISEQAAPNNDEQAGLGARGGLGVGLGGARGGLESGGLGTGGGEGAVPSKIGAGVRGDNDKSKAKEEAKKKILPAKLDAGFGGWEKNTKGIGKKLLMKMGFKGRLGKNEDGVTRQLEVKVRPGLSGLGFGNFKEATTLKVNREIEADRQGKTLEQMEAEMGMAAAGAGRGKGPKSREEQMADRGLWRKGATGRKRKRYITPEELLKRQEKEAAENGDANAPKKQIIVDMRGPQTKLVSTMDDLAPLATGVEDGSTPKLGQELLHNVGLMVGLAETEIQTLHRRRQAEADRAAALEKDSADLKRKVDASGERLSRLEHVETILFRVHDKVLTDPGAVTADNVLKAFHTLRQRFPEEYAVFGLAQLVPAMAAPVIRRSLAGWNPLQAPTEPAALLASWKEILTDTSGVEEGEGRARRWEGQAAFEFLANDLVLPAVRSALVNTWEVRDPGPALDLTEAMVVAGVGDQIVQALLEQAILPKLTRGVKEWNPRTDIIAIHTWIHPWLPLLGRRLADLFPEIRRKLAAVLVHWDPSDTSAHVMLSPWKQVFDSRSMEALLDKCIAPKLAAGLRASLVINPANQDMAPFNMLMAWADLIPPLYMTSILDVEFFPKWLTVLHRWLSETADYAEVVAWFQGWKMRFPESLRSDPRVAAQFNAALTLMDQVMKDHQNQGVPLPPGASEQMDYIRVVETRRMEATAARQQQLQQQQRLQQQQQQQQQMKAGSVRVTSSFRDVVEAFAESSGVMFLPKPGRQHEGKQIYSFGGVSIYLDQSVAFAEMPRGTGRWSPLGLEELLVLTGNKPATAPAAASAAPHKNGGAFGGLD